MQTRRNVCVSLHVREREREDHYQDFTVFQKGISFFRYLTDITGKKKKTAKFQIQTSGV